MSDSSINREQVFAIADALKAEGMVPSSGKIKDRLGVECSYIIISEYLAEWHRDPQRLAINQLPPPPESVSQGMSQVWTQAWLLNQQQISKERQEFELALSHIDAEKREMLKEIAQLEGKFQEQSVIYNRQAQAKAVSDEQMADLNTQLVEIEVEKHRWVREKQRLQAEADHLKNELEGQLAIVEQSYTGRRDVQDKIHQLNVDKIALNDQLAEQEYQVSLLRAKEESQARKNQWLTGQLETKKENTDLSSLSDSINDLNEQLLEKDRLLKEKDDLLQGKDKDLGEKASQLTAIEAQIQEDKASQAQVESSNVELAEKLQTNSLEFREIQQFNNDEKRRFSAAIEAMESDLKTYKDESTLKIKTLETELKNEVASAAEVHQQLLAENDDLKAALIAAEAEVEASQVSVQNLAEIEGEVSVLSESNTALNETNSTLSEKNTALSEINAALQNECDNLGKQIERYKVAYDKAAAQRKDAMSLMSGLKVEYTKLKKSTEQQDEQAERTQQRIDDLEIRISNFRRQSEAQKQERSQRKKTQVVSLKAIKTEPVLSEVVTSEMAKPEVTSSEIPVLSEIEPSHIAALDVDGVVIAEDVDTVELNSVPVVGVVSAETDVNESSDFELPHERKEEIDQLEKLFEETELDVKSSTGK